MRQQFSVVYHWLITIFHIHICMGLPITFDKKFDYLHTPLCDSNISQVLLYNVLKSVPIMTNLRYFVTALASSLLLYCLTSLSGQTTVQDYALAGLCMYVHKERKRKTKGHCWRRGQVPSRSPACSVACCNNIKAGTPSTLEAGCGQILDQQWGGALRQSSRLA